MTDHKKSSPATVVAPLLPADDKLGRLIDEAIAERREALAFGVPSVFTAKDWELVAELWPRLDEIRAALSASSAGAVQEGRAVARIERELEEFALWLNDQGLQHVAKELASRVVILSAAQRAAPRVLPVRMLTDLEVVDALRTDYGPAALSRVQAVQMKFCEVNGLSIGSASEKGDGNG